VQDSKRHNTSPCGTLSTSAAPKRRGASAPPRCPGRGVKRLEVFFGAVLVSLNPLVTWTVSTAPSPAAAFPSTRLGGTFTGGDGGCRLRAKHKLISQFQFQIPSSFVLFRDHSVPRSVFSTSLLVFHFQFFSFSSSSSFLDS